MKLTKSRTRDGQAQKVAAPLQTRRTRAHAHSYNRSDASPSARHLAAIQTNIDASPRMRAQRKQIAGTFGSAAQLTPQTPHSQISRPALQRHPDANPLVLFIRQKGDLADASYDLLVRQVEVSRSQVNLLEAYSNAVENDKDAELAGIKSRISETAGVVRLGMSDILGEADTARARAVGVANATDDNTPTTYLNLWSKDVLEAASRVTRAQATVASVLVRIKNDAISMARAAMAAHEIHMMRGLLKVADASDAAVADGEQAIGRLQGEDTPSPTIKERISRAVDVGDAVNNTSTGLGLGIVGAMAEGNVFSLSSTASTVLGIFGGALGIIFGLIGTILGVKNAIRGRKKKKALVDAKGKLSSGKLDEITDYAIGQKGKKTTRNSAAAVGGLIAVGAGVLGLVALSVATLGVAAIVAGMVAALIGLGFVGFRMVRNWRKRRAERALFADELIAKIRGGEEDAAGARDMVTNVGLNPAQIEQSGFRKKLIGKVGDYAKSKRTRFAEGLINSLLHGRPSEVFDAELILNALGVSPELIRTQVANGDVNKAIAKVASKLASW